MEKRHVKTKEKKPTNEDRIWVGICYLYAWSFKDCY